jgi:hypothetical protein
MKKSEEKTLEVTIRIGNITLSGKSRDTVDITLEGNVVYVENGNGSIVERDMDPFELFDALSRYDKAWK